MNDNRITTTIAACLCTAALSFGAVSGLAIGLAVAPAVQIPDSLTIDLASPLTLALEGLPETPLSIPAIPAPVALGGGRALIVANYAGLKSNYYYVVSVDERVPGSAVHVTQVSFGGHALTAK